LEISNSCLFLAIDSFLHLGTHKRKELEGKNKTGIEIHRYRKNKNYEKKRFCLFSNYLSFTSNNSTGRKLAIKLFAFVIA
jgi:hypothetical protein